MELNRIIEKLEDRKKSMENFLNEEVLENSDEFRSIEDIRDYIEDIYDTDISRTFDIAKLELLEELIEEFKKIKEN